MMTGPLEKVSIHDYRALIEGYFAARGYPKKCAEDYARIASTAEEHGVHTHSGRKAIELDRHHGHLVSKDAQIEREFHRWDAHHAPGPTVAYQAIDHACEIASRAGIGLVSVSNANHYLWGGGYALRAASQGFIALTTCTGLLPEVVPHLGIRPKIGTNPWTWALPTKNAIGFDVLADWATSQISSSTVRRFRAAKIPLPARSAIDHEGLQTTDASRAAALLPFGAHKGYSLGLITELFSAMAGNPLPSQRGRHGCGFFLFVAIQPTMIGDADPEDLSATVGDILRGNESSKLPGEIEHRFANRTADAGALIIPTEDVDYLNEAAQDLKVPVRL